MNKKHLVNIFKLLNHPPNSHPNANELENENNIKNILNFLQKYAKLLSVFKAKGQEFLTTEELATILGDLDLNENRTTNSCFLFDFKRAFQKFRHVLPEDLKNVNGCVLELFTDGLIFIENLIHNDPEKLTSIYQIFLRIEECICCFSSSALLDSSQFRNVVCHFVADLLKMLSNSDLTPTNSHQIKICCLVRKIVVEIAKSQLYTDYVVRCILKKIKCVLSYFKSNESFDGFNQSRMQTFEFYLVIIKEVSDDCSHKGFNLDDKLILSLKQALEDFKKFIVIKWPSVLKNIIEAILVIL